MIRTNTKIGDIFAARLGGNRKKYFQYVANDLSQLNSDVIRALKQEYADDDDPDLAEVVRGEVQFYAHCVTKWGVKMGLWERVGSVPDVGGLEIVFRRTSDYGRRPDEDPVRISDNWYVWAINGEHRHVGRLNEETRRAYVGLVINPYGIIELLKGNKYPPNYPD